MAPVVPRTSHTRGWLLFMLAEDDLLILLTLLPECWVYSYGSCICFISDFQKFMRLYMPAHAGGPWLVGGGQSITRGVGPHLPACFRRSLLVSNPTPFSPKD